jgi:hypothetical protein
LLHTREIAPEGVIRAIPSLTVNQIAPSGPAVIHPGKRDFADHGGGPGRQRAGDEREASEPGNDRRACTPPLAGPAEAAEWPGHDSFPSPDPAPAGRPVARLLRPGPASLPGERLRSANGSPNVGCQPLRSLERIDIIHASHHYGENDEMGGK